MIPSLVQIDHSLLSEEMHLKAHQPSTFQFLSCTEVFFRDPVVALASFVVVTALVAMVLFFHLFM